MYCKECQGTGGHSTFKKDLEYDEMVLVEHECEDCNGTGIQPNK